MFSVKPGSHMKTDDHNEYQTNITASRQFQQILDDCNTSQNSNSFFIDRVTDWNPLWSSVMTDSLQEAEIQA